MTEPTHTVRNSLIDKERTFALRSDAVHWSDAGGQGQMAYADVQDMRMISYPSTGGECCQCTLRDRSGNKVKLRSQHYRSLNNFENRSDTYAPFVRALAQRIAQRAPKAEFIAGSTVMWIVWLILGVLCALVGVLVVTSLIDGMPPLGAGIMAVAICLAAMPVAWRKIKEGRANTFDPASPPRDLLGIG